MELKTKFKILISLGIILLFNIFILIGGQGSAKTISYVPEEYYPNPKFQANRERLAELFIDIDTYTSMSKYNGSITYNEIANEMEVLQRYYPQDYSFQVTYKTCIETAKAMANERNEENFQSFMQSCKTPFSKISNTVDKEYTMKAVATANPTAGSAPITITFDARGSRDPSMETIATDNYFWYYRDVDGIDKPIGYGPVVKHQFTEEGTYIVHCTVRSTNSGILDGTAHVTISVSPKAANISVYANGKKMQKNKLTKVGIQEAKKGIIFDGSSTSARGGREILGYTRSVTSRDGFSWVKKGDGIPGYINLSLPGEGEYIVKLTVNDNENNVVSENYSISVSDPVAIIQQNPEKGNTSTTFGFSATTSYSLTSRLKLYTWELFDNEGTKLDTLQGKTIQRQFKKPGNYTVKLTVEDEMGLKNSDIINIYVESTPPIPQFSITPTNKRKYPSEFYFDAKASNDVDVTNGYDSLVYERSFSNPNAVNIIGTEENNRKITALFNETGTHTITLKITDNYGKTSEISKNVTVESIIRPELTIKPKSTVWGSYIFFRVGTNVPVINYQWNFGDNSTPRTNMENTAKYQYDKIGTYTITVTVVDEKGNTNEVSEKVFIGEIDHPVIGYKVKDSQGFTMAQNETCEDIENGKTVPAYRINRLSNFTIDTSDSVNAQGKSDKLNYYFQAKNDQIIPGRNFSHKFNELGCQYVDYNLEDSSINKSAPVERIRFKVVNALPTLSNLSLSYPQYGNEIGIGFQQVEASQTIFDTATATSYDPIIVKVTAEGASDPDGSISYFRWVYYPKNNPNKIIATKITPGTVPYTFFSVPRQPGEYEFSVTIFDNDDGTSSSAQLLGKSPQIIFPQSDNQPDIPLVTLKSDKINAEVGEEITFDVISKVLSDRQDFTQQRTIKVDFDGDGTDDYVGKDDRITRTYTKPSPVNHPYVPKAKVIYRDYIGMSEGAAIVVKNGLKPNLLYTTIGKKVIFKDISIGSNILEREICLDVSQCEKGNERYIKRDKEEYFTVTYPDTGTYTVKIKAKDGNGNEAENTIQVNVNETTKLQPVDWGLLLITLPETQINENGVPEIFVGKQLNNEILFFVKSIYETKSCYVDSDITYDSNSDGVADNDIDFRCEELTKRSYTPGFESTIGRIYYELTSDGTKKSRDFIVTFADYINNLDDTSKEYYKITSDLITTINDRTSAGNATLRELLIILRNDIANGDKQAQRGDIIQIQEFLKEKQEKLTDKQKEKLEELIENLSDHTTLSATGGGPYEIAKSEILALLPQELKDKIRKGFEQFESLDSGAGGIDVKEERRKILESITALINNHVSKSATEAGDNEIFKDDYIGTVIPNMCKIAEEYTIITQICNTFNDGDTGYNQTPVEGINLEEEHTLPTWLKVILWILGIIVLSFIGLIVGFAIKAKLRDQEEEDSDDE